MYSILRLDFLKMSIDGAHNYVKCFRGIAPPCLVNYFANKFGYPKVQCVGRHISVRLTVRSSKSSILLHGKPTDSFLATLFSLNLCHSSKVLTLHLVVFLVFRGMVSFNQDLLFHFCLT